MCKKNKHNWQIETANGPTSQGLCRDCGKAGTFMNSIVAPFVDPRSFSRGRYWIPKNLNQNRMALPAEWSENN